MSENQKLYEVINTQKQALKNFNPEVFEIPKYITDNLKHTFFDWQKEAFENLLYYQNPQSQIKKTPYPQSQIKKTPSHLMFNMATGTGKTLLMAATILYYYKKGYRHFIFFVNQNNIIDKTENNFIDNTHNKYLFAEKIIIDDKNITIEKVNTFSDEPQGIEIKFTSIQKLYNDIHLQKENQTTLGDLQSKNIVMLADEAHHLNANTKQKQLDLDFKIELNDRTGKNEIERKGWEDTVIELILNKQGKKENKNILLEFTATIPDNEQVAEKYQDKIIYKYDLKEFLQAGYTKEINLISSSLNKRERILQALLFQWYRHKLAIKYDIANFKPVILFRSKTIIESKEDYKEFLDLVDNIDKNDFNFLQNINDKLHQSQQLSLYEMGKSRTEKVLDFIEKEKINYYQIAEWIKNSFQEKNTVITNSKTNKTKKEKTTENIEKLLNSLEDNNNHIRAIFTVDRLTEGWDVLNLFDIVRLYQGQNAGGGSKKTPEATTKEKQLIGRGVRYFPFSYGEKIKNKRKFDNEIDHELRILEELFYYTYDEDSKYISHLKAELKKDGYITDDRVIKTFDLKESFKKHAFDKKTKIWYNQKEVNLNRQKKDLRDLKNLAKTFEYKIKSLELREDRNVLDDKLENQETITNGITTRTISKKIKDIEKHIFFKAINIKASGDAHFRFENLQKDLKIKSIDNLMQDDFLGNFEIKFIATTKYEDIDNKEKLKGVIGFLDFTFSQLKDFIHPKIGTEFKAGKFQKFFGSPKTKSIKKLDEEHKNIEQEILKNDWYVLDGFVGTSEEKALVNFIKDSMKNLEEKYQEIYLLRNEEQYKIYNFDDGKGFAPDFLLFLKSKATERVGVAETEIYYQIFIEPKGDQFKDLQGGFENSKEGWKENFLKQITEKYDLKKIIKAENQNYRLIGLPFFNENNQQPFIEEFNKIKE